MSHPPACFMQATIFLRPADVMPERNARHSAADVCGHAAVMLLQSASADGSGHALIRASYPHRYVLHASQTCRPLRRVAQPTAFSATRGLRFAL